MLYVLHDLTLVHFVTKLHSPTGRAAAMEPRAKAQNARSMSSKGQALINLTFGRSAKKSRSPCSPKGTASLLRETGFVADVKYNTPFCHLQEKN
jgi:hypothetical protein